MTKYKCKHCGEIVLRDSEKAWIKSLCFVAQKTVHLTRMDYPVAGNLVVAKRDRIDYCVHKFQYPYASCTICGARLVAGDYTVAHVTGNWEVEMNEENKNDRKDR